MVMVLLAGFIRKACARLSLTIVMVVATMTTMKVMIGMVVVMIKFSIKLSRYPCFLKAAVLGRAITRSCLSGVQRQKK